MSRRKLNVNQHHLFIKPVDPPKPAPKKPELMKTKSDDPYNDAAHARRKDPDTSKRAAAKVKAPNRQMQIRHALYLHGYGLTSFEFADLIDCPVQNCSSLFKNLVRELEIYVAGERFCEETGNDRQYYKLTEKGRNRAIDEAKLF